MQQHKISVEQLDSWIQEVDSDNCSLILTICSSIGRINNARNLDLRQEDIGPVICSDKSSITHQISQFVLRGSSICSTSWSFTRGESSMQQQQRRHGTFAPSRRPFMRGLDVAAAGRAPSLGVEVELGEDMIGAVARAAGQTAVAPPSLSAASLLAPPAYLTEDAAECSGNERRGLAGGGRARHRERE